VGFTGTKKQSKKYLHIKPQRIILFFTESRIFVQASVVPWLAPFIFAVDNSDIITSSSNCMHWLNGREWVLCASSNLLWLMESFKGLSSLSNIIEAKHWIFKFMHFEIHLVILPQKHSTAGHSHIIWRNVPTWCRGCREQIGSWCQFNRKMFPLC
jgi:hypothetical protein